MSINRRLFLRNTAVGGAAVAIATPSVAAEPAITPDERISTAIGEIAIALHEKWPDCPLRIVDCDNGDNAMILILTHIGDDKPGTVAFERTGTARTGKGGAA